MRKKIAEWYIRNKPKILLILFFALVIVLINIILVYVMKHSNNDDESGDRLFSVTGTINNNFKIFLLK